MAGFLSGVIATGLFSGIGGKTFSSEEDETILGWDTLDWGVLGSIELDWAEFEAAEEDVVSVCEEMGDADEETADFCWQEKRSKLDKIKNMALLFMAIIHEYYNYSCFCFIYIFNFMKK